MFAVLIPSYNDGESIARLISEIDELLDTNTPFDLDIHIVNDGGISCSSYIQSPAKIHAIYEIELVINIGHQRAIAVGLAEIAEQDYDGVIIMDGDGEDKPQDIFRLLKTHTEFPDAIIAAQRTTRSEGLWFRLFYQIYKIIFRILTGKTMDFGNFMLLPAPVLDIIGYTPDIWNHIAATMLELKVRLHRIPTSRGTRYAGRSRMNFESLVTHGLSAMSVYIITIYTRLLFALAILTLLVVTGILMVVGVRLFTSWAIPGWASNVVGTFAILLSQIIFLSLLLTFSTLNQRSSVLSIPQRWLPDYIKDRHSLYER